MSALPTPQDVLDFWIGDATNSPEAAGRQNKLWFTKSDETDAELRARFAPLLETLSHLPAAEDWAARGPQGRLAAGAPADLVLFDPDAPFVLDRATLRSKSRNTPFDGQRMQGKVLATYVAGTPVWRRD